MKAVFVSNYINHHQIPFCDAMYRLMEGEFAFIQTERMEEHRVQMGWDLAEQPEYVRCHYEEPEVCRRMIADCDMVIFGGTDDESYIKERLATGKPVIRVSERLYKTGQWKAVSPRGLKKKYEDHTRYRRAQVYLLCAGAYVPSDFHIIRAYPDKMFRWGYFPETRHYIIEDLLAAKGYDREKDMKKVLIGTVIAAMCFCESDDVEAFQFNIGPTPQQQAAPGSDPYVGVRANQTTWDRATMPTVATGSAQYAADIKASVTANLSAMTAWAADYLRMGYNITPVHYKETGRDMMRQITNLWNGTTTDTASLLEYVQTLNTQIASARTSTAKVKAHCMAVSLVLADCIDRLAQERREINPNNVLTNAAGRIRTAVASAMN